MNNQALDISVDGPMDLASRGQIAIDPKAVPFGFWQYSLAMKYLHGFALFLSLTVATASGKMVYINGTTGNDQTGDGSKTKPYKTFDRAFALAVVSGDDLIVSAGTYTNVFKPSIPSHMTFNSAGGIVRFITTVPPESGGELGEAKGPCLDLKVTGAKVEPTCSGLDIFQLQASVTKADPADVTVSWSGGPGVHFSSSTGFRTTVSFDAPGWYWIEATAKSRTCLPSTKLSFHTKVKYDYVTNYVNIVAGDRPCFNGVTHTTQFVATNKTTSHWITARIEVGATSVPPNIQTLNVVIPPRGTVPLPCMLPLQRATIIAAAFNDCSTSISAAAANPQVQSLPLRTLHVNRVGEVTKLILSGPPGSIAGIEASDDLRHWKPLQYVTFEEQNITVTDKTLSEARFYRLMSFEPENPRFSRP